MTRITTDVDKVYRVKVGESKGSGRRYGRVQDMTGHRWDMTVEYLLSGAHNVNRTGRTSR